MTKYNNLSSIGNHHKYIKVHDLCWCVLLFYKVNWNAYLLTYEWVLQTNMYYNCFTQKFLITKNEGFENFIATTQFQDLKNAWSVSSSAFLSQSPVNTEPPNGPFRRTNLNKPSATFSSSWSHKREQLRDTCLLIRNLQLLYYIIHTYILREMNKWKQTLK